MSDPYVPPPGSPAWLRLVAGAIGIGMEQTIGIKNTCIASTLLGTHYLARNGIKATPTSVWVVAENLAAMHAREQRLPFDQWPANAWSVAIKPGSNAQFNYDRDEDWTGHLVMLLRRGPNLPRTLIDPTASQLDRPAHQLLVPGAIQLDIPPGTAWTPEDPYVKVFEEIPENPTFVNYSPAPPGAPGTHTWKTSKSYERWHDPSAPLVAEMMDAIDKGVVDLSAMFADDLAQMRTHDDPGLKPVA